MGERNTSPSLLHWWKCALGQQHTCGMLVFIQHVWNPLSTGLLAVQWASIHTSYRYSHFCYNCYAHWDAVFFEHSTNMLHISHLLWLSAYHCKQHNLHPSTHHKCHSPHHPPKGEFHRMRYESTALHSRPHHPPMAFSHAGNENLSQWAQL